MNGADDDAVIVLSHRRTPARPAVAQLVAGLIPFAGFLIALSFVIVQTRSYSRVSTLAAVLCVLTAAYSLLVGLRLMLNGTTDLIARRRLADDAPTAMRLSRSGVEYSTAFRGQYDLSVPWAEVSGSGFRPGLGGTSIFCVDAAQRFPPLPVGPVGSLGLDPEVLTMMVALLGTPEPSAGPLTDPAMQTNLRLFGTPLVINLALCDQASVPELDRLLRNWSQGRCQCLPPDSAAGQVG